MTERTAAGHALVPLLSARQLQIAELVAQGLTNREIGDALSISQKTVETHLAAVFVKLGVSSRADVRNAILRASLDA